MSFFGHHAIRIVTYLCNVTGIPSWSSGELCKHNDYGQMDRAKCLRIAWCPTNDIQYISLSY
jgi:hypothetical protein